MLIQKCDIYNRITTIGILGQAIDTYTLYVSNVKCRSAHKNNIFGSFAGQVNAIATHIFYIDEQYILDTTNRIVIDGLTYQVIHSDSKYNGKGVHHNVYNLQSVESPQAGNIVENPN
jgi:hypothetical protein